MLKLKNVSKIYGMKVYTDGGEYFGDVEDLNIENNKVVSWKIKNTNGSLLSRAVGVGAKGVIVPHQYLISIGDIVILSKSAIPSFEPQEETAY